MVLWLFSVVIFALIAQPLSTHAVEYTFSTITVDFPSFRDDLFGCAVTGINDAGILVGGCNDRSRNSEFRGFLYNGRRFKPVVLHTKIPPANTAKNSHPDQMSVSPRSISVYQSMPLKNVGKLSIIFDLEDSSLQLRSARRVRKGVTPQSVNNQNGITGWYFDGTRLNGFLKREGEKDLTLSVPNSTLTEAVGINDFDQVVGDFRDEEGVFHGFFYENGVYTSIDFPTPSPADSALSGINNLGQMVGCHSNCSHGFHFDSETATFTSIDVPGAVLTQPRDINDSGLIVGVFSDGLELHGFLYDGTGFTVIQAPGAIVTNIFGVDNAGRIVGSYVVETSSGEFTHHAFLAVPVPIIPPVFHAQRLPG
jgi:hypothetical protein